MAAGLPTIDTDGDKKISRAEIEDRISRLVESQTGAVIFECRFSRNSKPITKAKVIFTPEPFLEGVIVSATGTTDARGMTALSYPPDEVGAQPGFYKVSIDDGNLPAKYNTETTLGVEVSGAAVSKQSGIYEFKLK